MEVARGHGIFVVDGSKCRLALLADRAERHGLGVDLNPPFNRCTSQVHASVDYHLILETKGFDPLEEIKKAAAERWIKTVNADGQYGHWQYAIARKPEEVIENLNAALKR